MAYAAKPIAAAAQGRLTAGLGRAHSGIVCRCALAGGTRTRRGGAEAASGSGASTCTPAGVQRAGDAWATIGRMRYNALAQVLTAKKTPHGSAAMQRCDGRVLRRRVASSPPQAAKGRGEWPPGWEGRDWQRMVDPGLEVAFVRMFDRVWVGLSLDHCSKCTSWR